MSKIFIFIFSTSLLINVYSQKKSGVVLYKIAEVAVPFKDGNPQNDYIKSIIEVAKAQKFNLKFNSFSSSFSQIETLDNEKDDENLIKFAKIAYTTADNYFLDIPNKLVITKTADNQLIKSILILNGWTILKDTKKIDKYLCYKAEYKKLITTRDGKEKAIIVTAWFAPSLPYSFGPKEFHGLPGLILELNDRYTTFLATKIELFDDEIKIDMPKGKIITQEEYEQKVLSGN